MAKKGVKNLEKQPKSAKTWIFEKPKSVSQKPSKIGKNWPFLTKNEAFQRARFFN
jgi:hypothetical protein